MRRLLFALLFLSFSAGASQCADVRQFLLGEGSMLEAMAKDIYSYTLDIMSYNEDQHTSPEYMQKKEAYDNLLENYYARSTNRRQVADWYNAECR